MKGEINLKKETKIKRAVIKIVESMIPSESNTTKFYRCMSILDGWSEDEENDFYFDLSEISLVKIRYNILKHYGL